MKYRIIVSDNENAEDVREFLIDSNESVKDIVKAVTLKVIADEEHGLNFEGEKNYLVMTMGAYKTLKECGEIDKLPYCVGILVPMPYRKKYKEDKLTSEYNNPTEYPTDDKVYLETIKPAKKTYRKRPMTEMLFCMLRTFHK